MLWRRKKNILTDFVNASSTVMTGSLEAFIDVDFAKLTDGAMRTSTFEVVD